MIYYYSEGRAAPMGNFQNYRRVPRAVKVVDRSLREEARGIYSTTARLPKEGVYNVSLLLDSPRVVNPKVVRRCKHLPSAALPSWSKSRALPLADCDRQLSRPVARDDSFGSYPSARPCLRSNN